MNVAQHSLLVADEFAHWPDRRLRLAALLHDASEAYLNDMASPVKHDPRMAVYREFETEAMRVIFAFFNISDLLHETERGGTIKAADDAVFRAEARSFFGGSGEITPWSASTSELCFLDLFQKLHPDCPF